MLSGVPRSRLPQRVRSSTFKEFGESAGNDNGFGVEAGDDEGAPYLVSCCDYPDRGDLPRYAAALTAAGWTTWPEPGDDQVLEVWRDPSAPASVQARSVGTLPAWTLLAASVLLAVTGLWAGSTAATVGYLAAAAITTIVSIRGIHRP